MSSTMGKRKQKYTRVGESQGDCSWSPGLQGCPPHSAKHAAATSPIMPAYASSPQHRCSSLVHPTPMQPHRSSWSISHRLYARVTSSHLCACKETPLIKTSCLQERGGETGWHSSIMTAVQHQLGDAFISTEGR